MAYALQKPFKDELDRLQKLQIIILLGVDKAWRVCNSFVLVPKPNGKVILCLTQARLNHALIIPLQKSPMAEGSNDNWHISQTNTCIMLLL